ncbi:hypothetical protein FA09DRAFT_50407 [Tilletiopsis washingtonensis]|uniref:Uncharacterized protein n=1 Tax=Tilletiopsis washingtonensis TaxID=58919 RepID=A0A316ZAV4_9BASI|nr:hypothetical protein FA09DRAFT_50407 [Tilletiopsis washingtonensis]PWN97333.1 hypothetical protein FA09DRAFT_50407 [Tilletiopsis washingtonensis]
MTEEWDASSIAPPAFSVLMAPRTSPPAPAAIPATGARSPSRGAERARSPHSSPPPCPLSPLPPFTDSIKGDAPQPPSFGRAEGPLLLPARPLGSSQRRRPRSDPIELPPESSLHSPSFRGSRSGRKGGNSFGILRPLRRRTRELVMTAGHRALARCKTNV